MRSRTEAAIYIAAYALIGLLTLAECSYAYGRIDEQVKQSGERAQLTRLQKQRGDYWQAKYQSLADEADFVTVLSAEAKFQERRR